MDQKTRSKNEIRQTVLGDLKRRGPGQAFFSNDYPLAEHEAIFEILLELRVRGWVLDIRCMTTRPRVKYPMTFGLTGAAALQ